MNNFIQLWIKLKTMEDYGFKLIDSTYSADDAKEVLISLVNDKIKFLNRQIFSLEERFGSDTQHLKNRVKIIQEEKAKLLTLLEQYSSEGTLLSIQCDVRMETVVPAEL